LPENIDRSSIERLTGSRGNRFHWETVALFLISLCLAFSAACILRTTSTADTANDLPAVTIGFRPVATAGKIGLIAQVTPARACRILAIFSQPGKASLIFPPPDKLEAVQNGSISINLSSELLRLAKSPAAKFVVAVLKPNLSPIEKGDLSVVVSEAPSISSAVFQRLNDLVKQGDASIAQLILPDEISAFLPPPPNLTTSSQPVLSDSNEFQSPQFAVGEVHSLTGSGAPIKVTMLAANPEHLPLMWVPKQPDSVISNNQLIHFTIDAAKSKSSYVYLIQKGRWSKSASLIFPENKDANNVLPAGESMTSGAFKVEPPSGRETLMVVASEQPVEWLNDPAYTDPFFVYAMQELSKEKGEDGLALSVVPLSGSTGAKKSAGDGGSQFFIQAITALH